MAPTPSAPAATDRDNILDVLSALEFGTKKEEQPLLTKVLGDLETKRAWTKQATADRILAGPGFQAFLFAVLREVKPFAAMLREVYAFLNDSEAITRRRASMFRVSSGAARAALDFSLDNFPRELLAALTETQLIGSIVELRFPGLELVPDQPLDWARSAASTAWDAIGPRWDNDFYDDGFHRSLSYAHMVLSREDEEAWRRLRGLVDPILDRLAAIVQCCSEVHPISIGGVTWSHSRDQVTFTPRQRPAHSHRIQLEQAGSLLRAPVDDPWRRDRRTVRDELNGFLHGTIIAIHLFENESYERRDLNWLQLHIGPISAAGYLDWMEWQSAEYVRKLDVVAPVGREFRETALQERLVEFLLLPFWKNRWFLYELWTLVLVLAAAARSRPIELEGVEERQPGALEWNLPGGTAARPVATIGGRSAGVLCWAQRKTLHPGTGEGLEPDLRLTAVNPAYHDLLIIENKDRRKPPGRDMREIARRYVEGTCTEGLWLLNYDQFPAGLDDLETAWPGRSVHVVSQFRPGNVPSAFLEEIAGTLARHLPPMSHATPAAPAATLAEIAIALSWGAAPRDLDLFVRVVRNEETRVISFRDRGRLTEPPFAELDRDVTSGSGVETVRVRTDGLVSLRIAVYNYSNEVPLSSSQATIAMTLDGRVTLPVPNQGADRWWIVADYHHHSDHTSGQLDLINLLTATAAAHGFE